MLLAIRERAKGIVAWVVIILIGAAFAAFGLANYMEPAGTPRAVAVVDGREISPDEVNRVYRSQRAQLEEMLGDRFDPAMIDESDLRREALNRVIEEHLFSEFIERHRLKLSDQDLAALIRSQEIFHDNGRFSSERYHQLLRANRMTSSQYEQQVRRSALMEQIRGAVGDTALVTERELEQLVGLQRQEREIGFIRLALDAFRDGVEVGDDEVRAHYEANADEYLSEERVRLDWVELRQDDLLAEVEVSDNEIHSRYEQQRDSRFTETERREVRHILVQLDQDADAETEEAARQRAEDLRARLLDGESFTELAEAESDDPGSARAGGDLGELERGDLDETFEEAAFALEEGELSEPVRTPFGFHLIEVTAVDGGAVRDFEDVRDQLARELAEERVGSLFFERANRLDEMAFESPDSLDPAAQALDLEVQRSDWLTRAGVDDGIGQYSEVLEQAFSEAVLEARQNSSLIELDEGRYVVVRVVEHEPPAQLEFEAVADHIRGELRTRKAREEAQALADTLARRLADGDPAEELAGERDDLQLEGPGFVTREEGAPWSILETAFRLERPVSEGRPSVGTTQMGGGDLAVVFVSGVRDADLEQVDDENRRRLREQLRIAYGDDALRDFVRILRAEADVEVFEDRL